MKKAIFFICLILSAMQLSFAQRSERFISFERLFYEGKTMYADRNYAGCIDKLNQYLCLPTADPDLAQEAEFLLAASAFKLGRADALQLLEAYFNRYPETSYCDETCFLIGSGYFDAKDYHTALRWLQEVEIDNFSLKDQEDCVYRMAYSSLQVDQKSEARRLFGLLRDNSQTYRDEATFYSAYLDYLDLNYNDAMLLFNQVKNNPSFNAEVSYYLTQIHFIQGRNAQAIKEGTELLNAGRKHKNNAEISRVVGSAYYRESDFSNAAKYLAQSEQLGFKLSQEDAYSLGMAYYNLGDYRQAADCFVQSNPGNDALGQNTYLFLGQSSLKLNDEKKAQMAFESASRMNFDTQAKETALYNYAMLLHKNAISAFGESVTVMEDFLNTYPQSIYADKVNDCLVDVYLTTKNYDVALQSIEKIKTPGRKILEAKQKIYFYLGTLSYMNANFDAAVDNFSKSIAMGSYAADESGASVYWRGETYYRQEKYDLAIRDFRQYLQSASKTDLALMSHYSLGYCYFKKNQYASAQLEFSSYISQEKDKTVASLADAYARLGDCYFDGRQFAEAEKAYSQSISLQPASADYAVFQKGFVMGLQKNYAGKITQMDLLVRSYPDSRYVTDAMYEKGRSYVMLEKNDEAIKVFESLSSLYPQSPLARKAGVQMGLLYFNQNDLQHSVESYKKVIELYPGSEEARVAAQDLKSVYVELNDIQSYANYIKDKGGVEKFEVSEQDSLTYLIAERSFLKSDENQAQTALLNYLRQFPDGAFSLNAQNLLGAIYLKQQEYAKAKAAFMTIIDAGNTEFLENALLQTAEIQYAEHDYANALMNYRNLEQHATTKEHRITALTGMIRSAFQTNDYMEVINVADALQKESNLSPEVTTEYLYYRAKAYMAVREIPKAMIDLKALSLDTRTVYGAEAKYLLAQCLFDNKETAKAESEVLDYIQKGTPHSYWLARGFILLSDIYLAQNDSFKAKQYLESLQHNYTNKDDDIQRMIEERMKRF
ncbi:MAG: tetratricopeptide repeat protein [Dysgonamonadaceae bacterium]|jgi:TolA-binding protein|nr:tetratricopeptide repeat protein [Dysgonamonadaceae bacterium]